MIFWWGSHCRHWSYTPIHCEFGVIWADGGVNFESNHAHLAVIRHSWIEFTICGCLSYWLRMTCSQLCQISREYPWYFLKSQTLNLHLDEALHRLPITVVNIWNMFVTNCLRPWETCTSWSPRLPEKTCGLCVYVSEHELQAKRFSSSFLCGVDFLLIVWSKPCKAKPEHQKRSHMPYTSVCHVFT